VKARIGWEAAVWLLGAAALFGAESYDACLSVRVTDEDGHPVPRARVSVSTFRGWVPSTAGAGRDETMTAVAVTDTNGCATVTVKSETGRLGCIVLPLPGFQWDLGIEHAFVRVVRGRWEPWAPQVGIRLKRLADAPAALPGRSTAP